MERCTGAALVEDCDSAFLGKRSPLGDQSIRSVSDAESSGRMDRQPR